MHHGVVRIGTFGLGGYAASICGLLQRNSHGNEPLVRLEAVCEPDQATHADKLASLRDAGVRIYREPGELLAQPLDAVWIPLPIDLHRRYTEMALAAGKAVMCEKPAAGAIDDLDAMIAARDRAALPVAVGFQDVYNPRLGDLQRRLREGEIGRVRRVSVVGCWPRDAAYYGRSWAGRLKREGVWILDSPALNAMAHYINLALYLVGPRPDASASPIAVEAELYRANRIENYDTCGLRITVQGPDHAPIPVLVLLTHACAEAVQPLITVTAERGAARVGVQGRIQFEQDGQTETIATSVPTHQEMLRRFVELVQRRPPEGPVATLELARPHLVAVNGASEAVAVTTVPAEHVRDTMSAEQRPLRVIPGIEALFRACEQRFQLPHETGLAAWATPAGRRDLRGYSHFAGPKGAQQPVA